MKLYFEDLKNIEKFINTFLEEKTISKTATKLSIYFYYLMMLPSAI